MITETGLTTYESQIAKQAYYYYATLPRPALNAVYEYFKKLKAEGAIPRFPGLKMLASWAKQFNWAARLQEQNKKVTALLDQKADNLGESLAVMNLRQITELSTVRGALYNTLMTQVVADEKGNLVIPGMPPEKVIAALVMVIREQREIAGEGGGGPGGAAGNYTEMVLKISTRRGIFVTFGQEINESNGNDADPS
jgi:hypothetical protein